MIDYQNPPEYLIDYLIKLGILQLGNMYKQQRHDALYTRSIGFDLTFDEWLKIWIDSGHLHERGARAGKYVMSRIGDIGPYSVENVKIISHSANVAAGNAGNGNFKGKTHSPEVRKGISERMKGNNFGTFNLGRNHTEETKSLISRNRKGKCLGNKNGVGYVPSLENRMKVSARNKGNKYRLGIPHTEEVKKLMGVASRAAHARMKALQAGGKVELPRD